MFSASGLGIDRRDSNLTLKFRHPDRFLVSGSETGSKFKFEEDIKANLRTEFVSLHSLSTKIKDVDPDVELTSLKHVEAYFGAIAKQLVGFQPAIPIDVVGKVVVEQTVLDDFKFDISNELKSECAIIFWNTNQPQQPLLVEFSFRYKDKSIGEGHEPFTKKVARRAADILNFFTGDGPLAAWTSTSEFTKTSFVFSFANQPTEVDASKQMADQVVE